MADQTGWHLKKEVNLTIIISIIGIAITCVSAYSDLKKDIELIKADTKSLHDRDTQTQDSINALVERLQKQLDKLDSKIDRLIERK